jgi:hypothetical protein
MRTMDQVADHRDHQPVLPTIETPVTPTEKIRERAYQLYEEHGRQDGHDVEDWLAAEGEIKFDWLSRFIPCSIQLPH